MARESKKNPADMPVEQKLKSLYQLQTMLSEIDEIKTLRGELPLEVQDLEDEVEGLNTRIGNIQNDITSLESDIRAKNKAIEEAKASIAKYEEQIKNVKNNREYDTLTKEIEFQNLEIELCQKKIREAKDAEAAKQNDIASSRQNLEERQADLTDKKNELDDIIAETKEKEEQLREKADALELTIEPRLLTAFKRIRKNAHNGLGIVAVQRGACGGCFNKIPPQRQLDIRMHKKIIVCEYCGRIMIDPELAGIKVEPKEEEKPVRKRRIRRTKAADKE